MKIVKSLVSTPFLSVLSPLCSKVVVDVSPVGPFYLASDSVISDQRGGPWRLRMSPVHVGFDRAGTSGEEPPEEVKRFWAHGRRLSGENKAG